MKASICRLVLSAGVGGTFPPKDRPIALEAPRRLQFVAFHHFHRSQQPCTAVANNPLHQHVLHLTEAVSAPVKHRQRRLAVSQQRVHRERLDTFLKAFEPEGPVGSGPVCIWTTWARTPSTACWPHCGASCSAMTILPRSTVRTMDATACRPACRTHGHERGAKNGWKACDRPVEVQENVRLRVLR